MNASGQPATDVRATRPGTLLVLSGPSGAGKSTVCGDLLRRRPSLHFSVSATTRAPRPGERDGVQYHFLSRGEFARRLAADAFLESAEVHGHLYGTLRAEVEPYLLRGTDVLLDIDVQGARQVRERLAARPLAGRVVFAFLAPPSDAELERRLRGRGTEPEEVIRRRLENARRELAAAGEYDHVVVNDTVADAVARLAVLLDGDPA
jgi:guanylate kinase